MRLLSIIAIALSLLSCRTLPRESISMVSVANEPPLTSAKALGAVPGRYLGYLRLKERQEKVPVTIDLIAERTVGNNSKMQALVKFVLGSFRGAEYSTLYFPDLTYNHKTKKFDFGVESSGMTIDMAQLKSGSLVTGLLKDPSGKVQGDFVTLYSGKRRALDVEKNLSLIFKGMPTVPSIGGDYAGNCEGKPTKLELSSAKWNQARSKNGGLFSDYKLSGRLGYEDQFLCGAKDQSCTKATYTSGMYDLFSGGLRLVGQPNAKTCVFEKNILTCQQCSFVKMGTSADDLTVATRRIDAEDLLSDLSPEELSPDKSPYGEYFGYLFHDQTGVYQVLRIKFDPNLDHSVSGVATLFFGDPKSNEFIAYRYDARPRNRQGKAQILNGSGETFLQLNQWTSKKMRGIWYSKVYGRLGTVQLTKGRFPNINQTMQQVRTLSGTYKGSKVQFNLLASADVSPSNNDFFPMNLKGIVTDLKGQDRKRTIEGASYDFMTGKIAFQLDDQRIVVGQIDNGNPLRLYWPSPTRFGAVMDERQIESYEYSRDPFTGIAAKRLFDLFKEGSAPPNVIF